MTMMFKQPATKKFNIIALTTALSVCVALASSSFAQDYYGNNYQNNSYNPPATQNLPPLQGHVATAPMGSMMMGTFSSSLSSEFARVGDRVSATLGTDLAAGGSIILPAGSQLEGQVMSVQRAGRAGRNGSMDVRFTGARLPNGQQVPLSAKIQTEDGTGLIKGGTGKGRLGKAAVRTGGGAAAGAILGTALGPLSGGSVGRGAIFGTAVGAGSGALYSAFKKGVEAELPAGKPVNIVLDAPLTVNPGAMGASSANQSYGAPSYNQYGSGGGYSQQQYSQPQYNNGQYNNSNTGQYNSGGYSQPQYSQPQYNNNSNSGQYNNNSSQGYTSPYNSQY
ncbi:MAG: hypothetical protein KTR14_01890 [Vampirovibrio sp.]|nr:hypothetical protein [Vampirovibrio sp.]